MLQFMKRILSGRAAIVLGLLFVPRPGLALYLQDPLRGQTVAMVAQSIVSLLNMVAVPILGIMVVWGGFQMMSAGGNESKFGEGRRTILYGVIGFAVVLLANTIVTAIREILGIP